MVEEIAAVKMEEPKENKKEILLEVPVKENKIIVAKTELAAPTEIVLPRKKEEVIVAKKMAQSFLVLEKKKVAVPVEIAKKELRKAGSETITEATRTINRVVVLKNEKMVEFTQIIYNNGGVYYFKNGASISSYAFEKEIQLAE